MGTITVNVSDGVENSFRTMVNQMYGKKKGSLGKALEEAMGEWNKKRGYFDLCMELLDSKVDRGGITYKKREELYDRNRH